MTVRDIMGYMETLAPQALAQEWDNVGLLVGDPETEVACVVTALDITPDTIAFAKAEGAELIVSHHPLIFAPLKRVVAPSVPYQLAQSGIAAFAAHTNLDAAKGGVNDALCAALGLLHVREAFDGLGRVGELPAELRPEVFAAFVKKRLHTAVQWREGSTMVRTVGVVSGGGGDFAADCEADAFVTGEMKHHEWIALPDTLTAVVAGHYATENVVVEPLASMLQAAFPTVRVCPFLGNAPYASL